MEFKRAGGVLLHPTSFPGPYGIGDLGGEAYRFVDFLQAARQQLWQILPLTPTGYGDSPYSSFSAFAGNPLLISPDILLGQGLLAAEDLMNVPAFSPFAVEFGPVIEWKMALLARSYERFKGLVAPELQAEMERFERENAVWLEDYALFMAAKAAHEGRVWNEWEEGLALRQPAAVAHWRTVLAETVAFQKYLQFLFYRQWQDLKEYANAAGVQIIGDIPIFVAYDSADVWGHPELFFLDDKGQSTVIAGVPPDYFSPTGQRWGNPLYRWDVMAAQGYAWWIERFRCAFQLTDIARLDHFRGFEAYWEVPVAEETAINGRWVQGAGEELFKAVEKALGSQPIIAEDLGLITPEVNALRKKLNFPGMKVLQFAFGSDAADPYLPHNYEKNSLVYTGTHDNSTTSGWLQAGAQPHELRNLLRYLGIAEEQAGSPARLAWQMVRLAWGSVADLAIVPMQDLLGVGDEGRMNEPGRASGNWGWRYHPDSLSDWLRQNLLDITLVYGRFLPEKPASPLVLAAQEIQEI